MTDIDNGLSDRERQRRERQRRWGTRLEGMAHSRMGSTTFNDLIQSGKIIAKKQGNKIIIDLDSVDEYIDSLPDAAKEAPPK